MPTIHSLQLTLEEFKLGRFESHHHRGCPDGHLQIADGHLRRGGGQFCGAVDARAPRPVFVSESAAVTATIRFYHFYNGNQRLDDNFSFTMRYKFLSNKTAAARYSTEQFFVRIYLQWVCESPVPNASTMPCCELRML